MDCPTITVHAGKCYKDLIDSGAAISLIRYSTYVLISNSFKTPIQPTTTKLNTVDSSQMTASCIKVLHLRIADFKFIYNFVICGILPDTEIIFSIDVQENSQYHMYGIRQKHLEPAIEDSADSDLPSYAQLVTHSTHSVTTQQMTDNSGWKCFSSTSP